MIYLDPVAKIRASHGKLNVALGETEVRWQEKQEENLKGKNI